MLCLQVLHKHGFSFIMETTKTIKSITKMQKGDTTMEIIIYVGIDVHKDTYSICCYDARTDRYLYEHKMQAKTANVLKYLKSVKEQLSENVMFVCGYEAGPTGFGLCRDLLRVDISCVVMAPTSLKRSTGKKVKNDRVDAKLLAKDLFTKDYSAVHISSQKEEAIKEFCRMRRILSAELKTSKQTLLSFLLRQGKVYDDGCNYWTIRHRNWLKKIQFDELYLQEVFEAYMITVNSLENRLKTVEKRLDEICEDEEVKTKVSKLVCFCGIDRLSAISIVSEVGDFMRFGKAWHFSNFVGLTVGEDSSGGREKMLGIMKAGNVYLRRLLIESVKSIKRSNPRGEKSRRLLERQEGNSPEIIAYADKCRYRLKKRLFHLESRGKHANVATTAAARELACFIWGMMTDNISA